MKTKAVFGFLILYFFVVMACQSTYKQGERIYNIYCSNCHGPEGEGFAELYPPINNSDYVLNNDLNLACIIRNGKTDGSRINGVDYNMDMPAIPEIPHTSLVNLINYISNKWATEKQFVSEIEVKTQLDNCR